MAAASLAEYIGQRPTSEIERVTNRPIGVLSKISGDDWPDVCTALSGCRESQTDQSFPINTCDRIEQSLHHQQCHDDQHHVHHALIVTNRHIIIQCVMNKHGEPARQATV